MKAQSILVTPLQPLRHMAEAERQVVSSFLFQRFRGMDEIHDRAWKRLWAWAWRLDAGEGMQLFSGRERSWAFHARWMAIEGRIFDGQECFTKLGPFRDWLKTGAHLGRWQATRWGLRFEPGSVAYDELSDDEMREFAQDATDFLRTAEAMATLWPHLLFAQRVEMLERLLADKDGNHG